MEPSGEIEKKKKDKSIPVVPRVHKKHPVVCRNCWKEFWYHQSKPEVTFQLPALRPLSLHSRTDGSRRPCGSSDPNHLPACLFCIFFLLHQAGSGKRQEEETLTILLDFQPFQRPQGPLKTSEDLHIGEWEAARVVCRLPIQHQNSDERRPHDLMRPRGRAD